MNPDDVLLAGEPINPPGITGAEIATTYPSTEKIPDEPEWSFSFWLKTTAPGAQFWAPVQQGAGGKRSLPPEVAELPEVVFTAVKDWAASLSVASLTPASTPRFTRSTMGAVFSWIFSRVSSTFASSAGLTAAGCTENASLSFASRSAFCALRRLISSFNCCI